MKKIITVAAAVLAFAAVASAQPKAIGIRGGYGAELSYQHYVGASNFAEFDLGMFSHSALVSAIYDFVLYDSGNFSFYAGPGAQVGMWKVGENSGLDTAIAGQIGLEFKLGIPLNISVDWRPSFHFIGDDNIRGFDYTGAALGIRYRF